MASVLRQTYSEWVYTVLDNRSTDDTVRVAEESAAGDPRIRVVRAQEFLGVYGNHNRALRDIAPECRYVKFVHADDWLYPECLERMVAVAEAHPTVGLVSSFRMEGARVLHDGLLPYTQAVMSGREVVRRALVDELWVTGSPTSVLLRADLVRGVPEFFDESFWHADTEAAYRVLMQSDLGFVHQVLTFTRLHPGALTSFSHRVDTYVPENLREFIRYGPALVPPARYRTMLRRELIAYFWFLSKEAVKPARWRDEPFHDYHRREIDHLLREAGEDPQIAAVLRLCRRLLRAPRRGRPAARPDKALPARRPGLPSA
jgi:glycosyltransferase involved in cell wall biosynthesis